MRSLLLLVVALVSFGSFACSRADAVARPDPAAPTAGSSKSEPTGHPLSTLRWDMSPNVAQTTLEARGFGVKYEVMRVYFAPKAKTDPAAHTNEPMLMLTLGSMSGTVYFDNDQKMARIELQSPWFADEAIAKGATEPSATLPGATASVRVDADGNGKWRRVVTFVRA